jgi:hypothetical protein
MAIPACLWRRTGEIYKGNKEFATLIDVSVDDLRDVSNQPAKEKKNCINNMCVLPVGPAMYIWNHGRGINRELLGGKHLGIG